MNIPNPNVINKIIKSVGVSPAVLCALHIAGCSDYNLHQEQADSLSELVYMDPCVRAADVQGVHYPSSYETDEFGNPLWNFILAVTPDFSQCGDITLTGVEARYEGRIYDIHMILDGEEQTDVSIDSENFGDYDDEDLLRFELYHEVVLYGPKAISIWPFNGNDLIGFGGLAFEVQSCEEDLGDGAFACAVEEVEVTYTEIEDEDSE